MKQSYSKEQHQAAASNGQALICSGWNGKYLEKPSGEAMQWGPANDAELKIIQKAFLAVAKSRGNRSKNATP